VLSAGDSIANAIDYRLQRPLQSYQIATRTENLPLRAAHC